MLWIWPTTWIVLPGFNFLLQLGDDLVDFRAARSRDRGPERWHRPHRPAGYWSGWHWSASMLRRNVATLLNSPDRCRLGQVPPRGRACCPSRLTRRPGAPASGRRENRECRIVGSVQKLGETCSDELRQTLNYWRRCRRSDRAAPRGRGRSWPEGRRVDLLLQMGVDDAGNGRKTLCSSLATLQIGCRGHSRPCARRSAPAARN